MKIFSRLFVFGAAALGFAAAGWPDDAGAMIYSGKPDLALTSAVMRAGGGPQHFSSVQLYSVLAGPYAQTEKAKLIKQFGTEQLQNAFMIFDYAVNDVVRIAQSKNITLPLPNPSPRNGAALASALYAAGRVNGERWDVGYMLERLMTHPIHHAIMHDMNMNFGDQNNARFHIILAQMMDDIAMDYWTASHLSHPKAR